MIADRNKKKSMRNETTGKKISRKHRKTNDQQREGNEMRSDKAKTAVGRKPVKKTGKPKAIDSSR